MMKILIADGSPTNCAGRFRLVEKMGYAVIWAGDGGEAVELYKRERPDLVLIDLMRPMMDSYEAARRIRGMFGLFFRAQPPSPIAEVMQCDREAFNRLFHAMLERGVYLAPSSFETGFKSSAHCQSKIDATFAAAREGFAGSRDA
jgi:CheY-like chemotaxis protein